MIKRFREIKRKKAKRRMKRKALKLLFNLFLLATGLFAVTFTVYFFNLDMKLVRFVVVPLLDKHYDSVPREHVL